MAVICDGPSDSTSFYRAMGPLGTLARTVPWLELTMYGEWTWAAFKMIDVLFMQRPFSRDHLQIAQTAKQNAKKIWLDYDDYLLDVPTENPLHRLYSQCTEEMKALLKLADVVTVSTDHLKRLLQGETAAEIVVIPNALDDTLFTWRPKGSAVKTRPIVAWRGSETHINDLLEVRDGYAEIVKRLGDGWQFHFWGHLPFYISRMVDKPVHHMPSSIVTYHHEFALSVPAIVVVPLADGHFNRSKSNCAWIEATLAGAVTVAPNWPEWNRKGVFNYENPANFAQVVIGVSHMTPEERQRANVEAWKEVCANYLLTKVNNQRISVLDKLVG
jgi:hypothetical protein